jgi:hypothetical protein
VVVAEVNDAVGIGRRRPQAVDIGKITSPDLGASLRDGGRGGVGASQADDLVPGGEQVGDDGRADPAGRSGDEDAHVEAPNLMSLDDITLRVMSSSVIT